MTNDEMFSIIRNQNETIIALLARSVWKTEDVLKIVVDRKKNPDAYVSIYNALDGTGAKTGSQLGEIAGVTKQTISAVIQTWVEAGIVLNVGAEKAPKYKNLMRLPERRKQKTKQEQTPAEVVIAGADELQETNGIDGN